MSKIPDLEAIKIKASQLERQTSLNQDVIKNTLFVIPENDGEAKRALQIINAVGARAHKSRQRWGAKLDHEWQRIPWDQLRGIDRVALFELPGEERNDAGALRYEEQVKQLGFELKIIDHHTYDDIDRYSPESSLEQLCRFIGWQMSPVDEAIAINDRSFIFGLKDFGLSNQEITTIRDFDYRAQGKTKAYIARHRSQAMEYYQARQNPSQTFWDISDWPVDKSFASEIICLNATTTDLSILCVTPTNFNFSGNVAMVEEFIHSKAGEIAKTSPEQLVIYSGGDPNYTRYFGVKSAEPNRPIPTDALTQIQSWLHSKLNS